MAWDREEAALASVASVLRLLLPSCSDDNLCKEEKGIKRHSWKDNICGSKELLGVIEKRREARD